MASGTVVKSSVLESVRVCWVTAGASVPAVFKGTRTPKRDPRLAALVSESGDYAALGQHEAAERLASGASPLEARTESCSLRRG